MQFFASLSSIGCGKLLTEARVILHGGQWFCTMEHNAKPNSALWPKAYNKILHCVPLHMIKYCMWPRVQNHSLHLDTCPCASGYMMTWICSHMHVDTWPCACGYTATCMLIHSLMHLEHSPCTWIGSQWMHILHDLLLSDSMLILGCGPQGETRTCGSGLLHKTRSVLCAAAPSISQILCCGP
jgi:hypothetical protein